MGYFATALAVCLALWNSCAWADYESTDLHEMVARAELIAKGEIVEVRDRTYVLRILDAIVGTPADELEIRRFQDWDCAWRWKPYEKGEVILVFAYRERREWRTFGAACEGENAVVDDHVLCSYPSESSSKKEVGKREFPVASYRELRAAILAFRGHVRIVRPNARRIEDEGLVNPLDGRIELMVSESVLSEFAAKSAAYAEIARHFVGDAPEIKTNSRRSGR